MFKGPNFHEACTITYIIKCDVCYFCICLPNYIVHLHKLCTHTYVDQMCQDCQAIIFNVMYGMLLKEIDYHAKGREVTFMTDLLWQLSKMAL